MKIIKESFKENKDPEILSRSDLARLGYEIDGNYGCFIQGKFKDGVNFDVLSDGYSDYTEINCFPDNNHEIILKVQGCNTVTDIKDLFLELEKMTLNDAKNKYPLLLGENKKVKSEDTIKNKKGKWVNKGKEGTHGEFNTKKQADAQRRAMFANGFKG